MAESMTLGFMLSAFIRQSEGLKKKGLINMVNFLFEKWGLLECIYD